MNQSTKPVGDAARDQFPTLRHGLYLNHAAIGPWPRCAAEAVHGFTEQSLRPGTDVFRAWIAREKSLRERLAKLVNATSADDIALLKNTTEGISLVAWGLDWQPGDNVVLPAGEFASNRLPWLAQSRRGVEVREVDIRAAAQAEAALLGAMDARTRLLSVSAVQWNDGFKLDLARLGTACRRRNVLFFVDAIQQLGALPIDVQAAQIDFLAADAHKWLLGPEGIAVFYCREALRPRLELMQQGWHMFDFPWDFERRDWTPSASAKRFEAGSPNSMGQAALHASTGLLLEQGMARVAGRVLANTDFLLHNLAATPAVRIVSRREPERRSGIVTFVHERVPAQRLQRLFRDNGVECAVRDGGIRLSPHFYQQESDLAGVFELLHKADH